jgi:hypothetical protein
MSDATYALGLMLSTWRRRIITITVILLFLVILFPIYYIDAVTLGPAFVFDRHAGRIDGMFLLCEIVAIVSASWFAQRALEK